MTPSEHDLISGCATALEVVRSLLGPGEGRSATYLAVGSADAPRFLLPSARRAAMGACFGYNRLRERRVQIRRAAVGGLVAVGAGRAVGRPVEISGPPTGPFSGQPPLLDLIAEVFGVEAISVAVGLGSFDHWWKPVLQVFSPSGAPIGYVKIGWTPTTRDLVRTEGESLEACSRSPVMGLVVPRLVHRGTWGECEVVATAPMPRRVRRLEGSVPPPVPAALALMDGPTSERPLRDTDCFVATCAELAEGIGLDSDQALRDAVVAVDRSHGDTQVVSGRWHGDWVPWNLASVDGQTVAWDWEYSGADVPVGMDDIQGAYQAAHLLDGEPPAAAFETARARASALMGAGGRLDAITALQPLLVAARIHRATRTGSRPTGADALVLAAAADTATRRSPDRGGGPE